MARTSKKTAFLRHPYLQNVQSGRASVLWTTAEAGAGVVTATAPDGTNITATAYLRAFDAATARLAKPYCQYQADLTGLKPATHYTYQVKMESDVLASGAKSFHFRTAASSEFSFLVFGDSGNDSAQQATLVQMMNSEADIAMALHVGDLAYPDGTYDEFESSHYAPNAPLMRRLSLFSTPGNHEYNTDSAAPYLSGISMPASNVPAEDEGRYYSFDWSNVHFTSVDSNLLLGPRANAMLAWLDADLAATPLPWRVVFLHHPPYPTGFHLGDPLCVAARQLVVPIVERHGVQLVLSGHEHGYERSYPLAANVPVDGQSPSTTYIISGGGGGALESVGSMAQCALSIEAFNYLRVDVNGDALVLRAIGLNAEVLDTVTLGAGATRPSIDSVKSVGGFAPALASGSLVAIAGRNLAPRTLSGSVQAPPSSLDGVVVTAGGVPAPLLSVSPGEINALIPEEVSGRVELQVWTHQGSVSANVDVLPAAPSILAVRAQNRPLHFCNPVRPGANVKLYLSGLGAAAEELEVRLGKTRLTPTFIGKEPGRPGVYRVEATIPSDLPDGLYSLQIAAGGVQSRPANVDIFATDRTARSDRAVLKVETPTS